MKVIIAGTRTMTDPACIDRAIVASGFVVSELVSGGAKGVDALAEQWAALNKIPVRRFLPDWAQFGRAAGPVRNSVMADYAEALIAIWDGHSKGTRDMIEKAEKSGLRVYVARPQR